MATVTDLQFDMCLFADFVTAAHIGDIFVPREEAVTADEYLPQPLEHLGIVW